MRLTVSTCIGGVLTAAIPCYLSEVCAPFLRLLMPAARLLQSSNTHLPHCKESLLKTTQWIASGRTVLINSRSTFHLWAQA